jgi:hypothetical protein
VEEETRSATDVKNAAARSVAAYVGEPLPEALCQMNRLGLEVGLEIVLGIMLSQFRIIANLAGIYQAAVAAAIEVDIVFAAVEYRPSARAKVAIAFPGHRRPILWW